MNAIQDATERMRRDLLERQDAWVVAQAEARGMTVEELAQAYYIEYEPIEVERVNADFIFRATQEMRLKRRDGAAIRPRRANT